MAGRADNCRISQQCYWSHLWPYLNLVGLWSSCFALLFYAKAIRECDLSSPRTGQGCVNPKLPDVSVWSTFCYSSLFVSQKVYPSQFLTHLFQFWSHRFGSQGDSGGAQPLTLLGNWRGWRAAVTQAQDSPTGAVDRPLPFFLAPSSISGLRVTMTTLTMRLFPPCRIMLTTCRWPTFTTFWPLTWSHREGEMNKTC